MIYQICSIRGNFYFFYFCDYLINMLKCAYCKKQIYTDSYYTVHFWKGLQVRSVTLHWECVIKLLKKYNTTVVMEVLEKEGVV